MVLRARGRDVHTRRAVGTITAPTRGGGRLLSEPGARGVGLALGWDYFLVTWADIVKRR